MGLNNYQYCFGDSIYYMSQSLLEVDCRKAEPAADLHKGSGSNSGTASISTLNEVLFMPQLVATQCHACFDY